MCAFELLGDSWVKNQRRLARQPASGTAASQSWSAWAKLGSRQAPSGACRSQKECVFVGSLTKIMKKQTIWRAGGSVQARLAPEATMNKVV